MNLRVSFRLFTTPLRGILTYRRHSLGVDDCAKIFPCIIVREGRGNIVAQALFAFGACCAACIGIPACLCEEGTASETSADASANTSAGNQYKSSAVARTFLQTGYGNFKLDVQVASYNVQCDGFKRNVAAGDDSVKVPNLEEELDSCRDCHIICLQEVTPDHYRKVFVPGFAKVGYNGTYISHRLPSSEGQGMSIFWKADTFEIESYSPLRWREGSLGEGTIGGVFVLALKHRPSDTIFMVASAHLCGEMSPQRMKQVQSSLLFRALRNFTLSEGIQAIPVIMCEDFNSLPWGSKAWQFDGESSTMTQLTSPETGLVRFQQGSLSVTIPMEEIERSSALLEDSGDVPVAAAFVECILFSSPHSQELQWRSA